MEKSRFSTCLIALFLLSAFSGPSRAAEEGGEIALLKAQLAQLSARLAELEASSSRTEVAVENLGEAFASAPQPSAAESLWADRVKFSGNLRYRNEWIDVEDSKDRYRNRIRARLGASAKVLDSLTTHIQFATGSDDPRSTNQTLGGNFSTKGIGLDLAYFDWDATDSLSVLGGKMKNPIAQPKQSRFIDGDITPEGVALAWNSGDFFALGSGYWGVERSSDDDTYALILQGGFRHALDNGIGLTAAVSYTDWANVKGFDPFYDGDPFGNSVGPGGNLIYDYDIVEGYGEVAFSLDERPLIFYAQYGVNTEADNDDTAWSAGMTLGKTSGPGTWELGYAYHDHEKDALFAQVVDSDFANGQTDARGHVLTGSYAFSKAVGVSLSYFNNELDASTTSRRDYQRVMLDLNIKY